MKEIHNHFICRSIFYTPVYGMRTFNRCIDRQTNKTRHLPENLESVQNWCLGMSHMNELTRRIIFLLKGGSAAVTAFESSLRRVYARTVSCMYQAAWRESSVVYRIRHNGSTHPRTPVGSCWQRTYPPQHSGHEHVRGRCVSAAYQPQI